MISDNASWNYTEYAFKLTHGRGSHEEKKFSGGEKGKWQGRELIHRDSRINGGVYLCAWGDKTVCGEACVVDD